MPGKDVPFRLLFEASPEVLLVLLPDSPRFTMVAGTRARFEVTGISEADTLGRGIFEVFPDNPDDPGATGAANLRASLERVLATRKPDTMAVQKYDVRGPDGSFNVRYWSPKNLPVLSDSGEVRFILHRVEEVTDLVRASEAGEELRGRTREMEREVIARSLELADANRDLRTANVKLGELDAAKTVFFSNVSHELRTPLTLMIGPLADSLEDRAEPLGPVQRARIALARDNTLRLLKLVNALLDFSRLEAGRLRARFAPLDIGTATAELAGMFQSAAQKAGLVLRIACPPPTAPAWVDRELWEKIVLNLVSNAFKFTLTGRIEVRVFEEGDRFVLEVADTGAGIPADEQPRVFERFHRVAATTGRTHEGTGIGLSLVRELVHLHGGAITLSSAVGHGSTFRVEIPQGFSHLPGDAVSDTPVDPHHSSDADAYGVEAGRLAAEASVSDGVAPAGPVASSPDRPRARVLVVDDNADLRGYLSALLAPVYDVQQAVDGQAALDAIRVSAPDLVVSDVMMPRLDGVGLVRALRADPATTALPVVLLSARAGEEASIEGLDAGSDDYLVKPFAARELLARVRTHLELSRLRRAWADELARLNQDLALTNRDLDEFASSVSHDLRAPVRAVQGFVNLLATEYAGHLPADARELLDHLQTTARRMDQLIDDLLRFSRFGRLPLTREEVSIDRLVRDVLAGLEAERRDRDIEIHIGDLPDVVADASLLRQVFVNLLSNALKFTRGRSPAVIEIGCATAFGADEFFVRDNGAGFDMQYAGKLFGPFQRLHSQERFAGTGLGLSLAQRIVERHGGRMRAEGAPGAGATFYVALPR